MFLTNTLCSNTVHGVHVIKTQGTVALVFMAIVLSTIPPVVARDRDFHGRDFARFSPRERELWKKRTLGTWLAWGLIRTADCGG
jgi:hypothetical protein